jgi:hypothetical protein
MPKEYENPLNPENHKTPWEVARQPRNAGQFYDKISSGSSTLTAVPMDLLRANGATFFRSDDRPTAEIFRDGFAPRDSQGIVYRLMKQDIHPHTAVCVTGSLEAASLFPIKVDRTRADFDPSQKEAPEETRVYVVAPKALFDTHDIQARFAAKVVRDQGVEQQAMAQGNLFGLERAAPRIAPEDVIGAFTIKRTWAGRDYLDGGTYEVTGYTANPRALAHTDKDAALRALYATGTTGNLAVKTDVPETTTALVAHYKEKGNVSALAPDPKLDSALSKVLQDSQKVARESVGATRAEQAKVWDAWKEQVSKPDQGIDANMPVTVRKIDDRTAFLAEIEKFELRMKNIDERGANLRMKHFDQGNNTPGTEQYVAYKNNVPVGWMTLDTSAGARIDKICTDINPVHDAGVGTKLLVEAVGASLRHGGNGTASIAGPDTLQYASTDGDLYARMGFHDAGGRSELFPSNHVRRDADGAPTHPYWEVTPVPLGTFSKHGNAQFGQRLAYVQDADHRLEPTAVPQLTAPERPKLFNDAMTAINKLGPVKGLHSDYDRACMAASLAVSARESGMTQIDTVVPGTKNNLIAVQGDSASPACQRASTTIGLGAMTPLDASLAQLNRPLAPVVATPDPVAREVVVARH